MRKIISIIIFLLALSFVFFSEPKGVQESPLSNGMTELNFWGIYDLPEVYEPIIQAFEREHSNVEVRYRQIATTEEYHELLLRQLEKGKGPDIFLFGHDQRELYSRYLTPSSAEYSDEFVTLAREDLVKKNLLYGLPFWVDSLMLYYNKRFYPEGLQPAWYDFAEQTTGIKVGGIAMGRFDHLRSAWDILKALFLQKDIKLTGTPENSLYDTLEFFNRFAYPIDKYFNWNEKLSRDYVDKEVDSFAREKVAAIAGFTPLRHFIEVKAQQWKDKGYKRIKTENISVATFPQFDLENPKYLAKYTALGVSVYSGNPTLAWEFVKHMTSTEQASYFQEATGRTPGRILPVLDTDTDVMRIQKQQLLNVHSLIIPEETMAVIEEIAQRAVLDKRVLLEVLDENFK